MDAEGSIRYDAIARQGHSENRVIHSQFKDLVPLNQRVDIEKIELDRPTDDLVKETTDKTREALEKIVQGFSFIFIFSPKLSNMNLLTRAFFSVGKIRAAQPKNVKTNKPATEPAYIRYTPAQQGESFNSGASQRIIRMVEMPTDPMEPPKFKHKKVPRGKLTVFGIVLIDRCIYRLRKHFQ